MGRMKRVTAVSDTCTPRICMRVICHAIVPSPESRYVYAGLGETKQKRSLAPRTPSYGGWCVWCDSIQLADANINKHQWAGGGAAGRAEEALLFYLLDTPAFTFRSPNW